MPYTRRTSFSGLFLLREWKLLPALMEHESALAIEDNLNRGLHEDEFGFGHCRQREPWLAIALSEERSAINYNGNRNGERRRSVRPDITRQHRRRHRDDLRFGSARRPQQTAGLRRVGPAGPL